ncbi:MAG: hydroxyethylthiazole kinase [Candidatus Krumholzibacteriota bacterium]|nr:hydroxyethylthiazole kinase [Candidatus Krumholzibacteriota bacterium]
MTTNITTHVTLQYSHTIGRAENSGAGFQFPVAVARGAGDKFVITDLPDDAPGRIESTARIARDLGAVVIHKGPTSLVAHPTEGVFVCAVGNSTLATGGTGDVLTGFVASFIAQGAQPLDGALVATFLHGRAGEAAGEERGRRGAIASDLFHTLAETMIALEAMAGD